MQGPPSCPQGTWHLPCSARLHLLRLPAGGGEGIHCRRNSSWNRDKQGVWDAEEVRRQRQAPFSLLPGTCSHCSSRLTTPAMGTSTLQLQHLFLLHGSMLPSLPGLSPTPLPSENHRQRDQLDQNLNQHKCEIKGKKKVFCSYWTCCRHCA